MPRTPTDYAKTVMYKFVCKDLAIADTYVGHTTDFRKRKNRHKTSCNGKGTNKNYKIYKTINENGGWDNWDMIEIEKYSCNDGSEARARERYWYETLNATMNVYRPIVLAGERKVYLKHYHQTEKSKEYQKQYYQTDEYKEYHKQYRQTEEYKEYKKQYHQTEAYKELQKDNRQTEAYIEYHRHYNQLLFICECGKQMNNSSKFRHLKSKKHLEQMNVNIISPMLYNVTV